MTRSFTTTDSGAVLRMDRRLRHPVDKVWRAITEPAELGHWFPSKVEVDLVVGGKVRFIEPSPEHPDLDGVVTDLDPPHLFAYTWDTDHLRWELRPDGDGTLLTLTHTFADTYGAPSFASGWTGCIDLLERLLAGSLAGPSSGDGVAPEDLPDGLAGWAELHEQLIEEFGLDQGTAERADGVWVVRFERQMTRDEDTVWTQLTGGVAAAVGSPAPAGFTAEDVPAGPVTSVDPAARLAYESPAGTVRFDLTPGAGGARLIVTHTTPTDDESLRDRSLAAWHDHLQALAAQLRAQPVT
jgi:uncharacterized protein YndB with AHSA1/START domain